MVGSFSLANSKLTALGDRGALLTTDIIYVVNPLTGLFYKATIAEVITAMAGFWEIKGSTDCSGNPNYPAASKGDVYGVSVAGKIGGASGVSVDVGDVFIAFADNAGGTQAAVGTSWIVVEHNIVGALLAANNLSDIASPASARVNLSVYSQAQVDALIATVSVGNQGQTPNGVVSGLGVAYSGAALTFDMAAGSFNLNGSLITAAQQQITLTTADATNPRIDVIYVDDTGTIGKVTGTAAASPSQPAVDPTSQLFLTFVQVPATATTVAGITNENIYLEDTEWPSTVIGSGVTKASTSNPYAGTKDVEFTNTPAASGIKFVRASAISFDGEGNLLFRIRSKATWGTKRWLTLQWFLAGVAKGAPVVLKSGTFGFDSSVTASYQLAVISKLQFAVPAGTNVDEFRVLDVGGAIGLYLDNIILQSNGTSAGGSGSTGITQAQADARYAPKGLLTAASLTQNTARLLGRATAAVGGVEEIVVGSGLLLGANGLSSYGAGTFRGAMVNKSVDQTAANYNAGVAITWDQEQYDTDNIHAKASVVTVTIASPGVITWNAHGLIDGQPVQFTTTGALPTGLVAATTYFVKSPTTNTFNLALTSGGAAINTTGSQSGVHTLTTNPEYLIVPAGVSKVRLTFTLRLSLVSTGSMQTFVQKNGAFTYVGTFGISYEEGNNAPLIGGTSMVLAVTPGDFFNVFHTNADPSITVVATSAFAMEIIE
jgi:hypothetical protein